MNKTIDFLVLCDEMQAAEIDIQSISLSDSFVSLRRYRQVDGPFTARCTLLADIMAQSPTVLDE